MLTFQLCDFRTRQPQMEKSQPSPPGFKSFFCFLDSYYDNNLIDKIVSFQSYLLLLQLRLNPRHTPRIKRLPIINAHHPFKFAHWAACRSINRRDRNDLYSRYTRQIRVAWRQLQQPHRLIQLKRFSLDYEEYFMNLELLAKKWTQLYFFLEALWLLLISLWLKRLERFHKRWKRLTLWYPRIA